MYLPIDELLKKQKKTRYFLSKETGMTYLTIINLCTKDLNSIRFETITKLCAALDCTPNDLINIETQDGQQ